MNMAEAPGPAGPSPAAICAAVLEEGYCHVPSALGAAEVAAMRQGARDRLDELRRLVGVRRAAHASSAEPAGIHCCPRGKRARTPFLTRFREIVERDGGRFDFRHRMDAPPFAGLAERRCVRDLVDVILGRDAVLQWVGVVVALGSASRPSYCEAPAVGAQRWHQDGPHLFSEEHAPPHCINVFVPLVDVDAENGATQFVPGSCKLGVAVEPFSEPAGRVTVAAAASDLVVFDYRTWHRGGENRTAEDRMVLYLTFAKPWFEDRENHRVAVSVV